MKMRRIVSRQFSGGWRINKVELELKLVCQQYEQNWANKQTSKKLARSDWPINSARKQEVQKDGVFSAKWKQHLHQYLSYKFDNINSLKQNCILFKKYHNIKKIFEA